ncbi:glycosyltransferase [Citricoccus sp. I39-566]|uniref:glycosyltransferase family 2 protein n=1 Tax=Citricoccus sp. I39-566 TaxID=3073268 RepID=UPI00286CA35F|nr:glycosyltransferase [Citricoccus sp. I39-566]WMY77350.1 glycosyltransferase [Citricoccus sp. I39-566]
MTGPMAPPRPPERTTVVVATRNRREELLAYLGHHEAPVIVVDNASTDGSPEAIEAAFPRVRVVRLPRNRGAQARTVGARLADTEFVAFADDDSWWSPGALRRGEELFAGHPRLGLLAASIAVGPDEVPDPINAVLADSPLGPASAGSGPRLLGFVACAAMVRRSAFLQVGGFDPVVRFPGEEERVALDLAASGWELAYAPELWVHHHPSSLREPNETRQRELLRSRLLTTVMRRPWAAVGHELRSAATAGSRGRHALASALPRIPAAVRRRRPVPASVEADLARLRPRATVTATPAPPPGGPGALHARLSVVMITYNRRTEALQSLERLASLPERPRVVVVDNGSTDGTATAIRERYTGDPQIVLVASPDNLGAVGRNLAMEQVTTEFVAFCDDDTWWEPGALDLAVAALSDHPLLGVVTGRILVEPGGRDDPINEELLHSPVDGPQWLPGPALGSFLAGASVMRTAAFREVGGFSPRLWLGGEEELMAADLATAGWELCHLPEMLVHHQASTIRDPHLRRRHGLRNTLWFIWLRRPVPAALRRTRDVLSTAPRDRTTVAGITDALGGAGWVLRERRVLPPGVERRFLALEDSQRRSKARQYVS